MNIIMNIIQQKGNENIQTYQVEAAILIQHQVLITNLQGNVQQLEGRINNQILGVKGLMVLGGHQLHSLIPVAQFRACNPFGSLSATR